VFEVVGGERFAVHRCVLGARSPVISAERNGERRRRGTCGRRGAVGVQVSATLRVHRRAAGGGQGGGGWHEPSPARRGGHVQIGEAQAYLRTSCARPLMWAPCRRHLP
jgi:hypothetical protein